MLKKDQIELAKSIRVHSKVLCSWLHTFTYIRNICAHHGRIWNRELAIAMIAPKNLDWDNINIKRIGSVIIAIFHFLNNLSVDTEIKNAWFNEIDNLLSNHPNIENCYHLMGLPDNYKNHVLWHTNKITTQLRV